MTRNAKRSRNRDTESPSGFLWMSRVNLVDITGDSPLSPPSDVHETPAGVVIRMEFPGVPPEGVDVRVRGATIEISAEKRSDLPGEDASYLCLERVFGKFRRAFEVSGCLNLSRVTAVLAGGVLSLTIPKMEERRGRERRVPVLTVEETKRGNPEGDRHGE